MWKPADPTQEWLEVRTARRYLGPEDTDHVSWDEVAGRLPGDDVVIVDVRPALEYAAGHIPGAISIPIDELLHRLSELPTDRDTEIIVYCRGQYCLFAHDAVRTLTDAGLRAVRLDDGIVEWRQAHRPLDDNLLTG